MTDQVPETGAVQTPPTQEGTQKEKEAQVKTGSMRLEFTYVLLPDGTIEFKSGSLFPDKSDLEKKETADQKLAR